jgi:hypothetical protein
MAAIRGGSKPKATVIKLARGNPGKRPLPKGEPVAEGKPRKPAYVRGRAAELWNELVEACPWLCRPDSYKMGVWCGLQAQIEEMGERAMLAATLTQWRILGSDLGLDPGARVRMATGQDAVKADDPTARYLANTG